MRDPQSLTGVGRDASTFPGFASYVGTVAGRVVCEIRLVEDIADDEAIALAELVISRIVSRPRLTLL